MRLFVSLCLIFSTVSFAQVNLLQPYPKKIISYDESVFIYLGLDSKRNYEVTENNAFEYLIYLISEKFKHLPTIKEETDNNNMFSVEFLRLDDKNNNINDQYYKISFNDKERIIRIESLGQLGLIYGAVTLSDLMYEENGYLKIKKTAVEDAPTYKRRLFVADPSASDITSLLDWALRNKLETVVIASRRHPWYEISGEYLALLEKIKSWRDKFGAPEIMQSHNIYEDSDIVISKKDDVDALKNVIKVSYEHGLKKLMILSDDTPPFKFGEGYILTDENDKKQFEHFEAANTYLINELVEWFKQENMEMESYYVPAFYTYEEMHQGDMWLFIDTPWEKDAFGPFYRDLKYIGTNMDKSVYLVWCGPYVRSRKITLEDLNDWTNNLNGRVPFLWDNTIYSHYPFTSTSMLTAWNNELPENFSEITAGNGMFINNDANSETGIVGTITTNDYLWNPDAYDPVRSLETAIIREYGIEVKDFVLDFKDIELNIRKTIGQRKLWFEADSLWDQIRKIRFITDKNPFYYHLNYTRLKTLRLQLKASVPEPEPKDKFIEQLNRLFSDRSRILSEIKKINQNTYNRLKVLTIPVPDLNSIQ